MENVHVSRRVFQRRALYLGELNDSQHAERKIRGAMKTLLALDKRIGRSKWRTIEASDRKLTRDELIRRLAVAESKAGRA